MNFKDNLVGGEVLTLLASHIKESISQMTNEVLRQFETAGLAHYYELLYSWVRFGRIEDSCVEVSFVIALFM